MENISENTLLSFIYKDEKKRQPQENEYIDQDGYIHCSVCKKPKQSEVGGFLHPEMCDCQRKERERAEAEEKAERHRRIVENRRKDCFESVCKYADCTFECSDTTINGRITDFCFNYCVNWRDMESESVGLIFCGNVGRGKTHLAACICNNMKLIIEAIKILKEAKKSDYYSFLNRF